MTEFNDQLLIVVTVSTNPSLVMMPPSTSDISRWNVHPCDFTCMFSPKNGEVEMAVYNLMQLLQMGEVGACDTKWIGVVPE